MPLREQSRIKADTVAEECTCEGCPAPAPDVAPTGFRIVGRSGPGVPLPPGRTWVRFGWYSSGARAGTNGSSLDAFDPPVMVEALDDMARGLQWDKGCWEILEPIPAPAPEPSAPMFTAESEARLATAVEAHPAPFAHDCDIVPGDEIPTAEECAETVKRLGIDVLAWAADIRKRVAAVATGGGGAR